MFLTMATIGRFRCYVMINSGSTENFVSQYVIDKLKMSTEKIVKPYKVSWSKEGVSCLMSMSDTIFHRRSVP